MVEIHFMHAVLVQRVLAIAHALVGLACTAFCIACGTAPPCSDAQLKRYSNSVWRHHICVWFALTVSAVAIGVPTQQCLKKKRTRRFYLERKTGQLRGPRTYGAARRWFQVTLQSTRTCTAPEWRELGLLFRVVPHFLFHCALPRFRVAV